MRRDESWQGRRWLKEAQNEIEAQANVESDKADLQMWKSEDADGANYNIFISYQSQNHNSYQCAGLGWR